MIGFSSTAKADTRWVTFHIGNEVAGWGNVIISSNFAVVPSCGQNFTSELPGASRNFMVYGAKRATVVDFVKYRNFFGVIGIKEFTRVIEIPDKGYFIYIK